MKVPGPAWITEALPQPQYIAERCGCTLRRCRVDLHEGQPLRDDPRRLRLLQHHLADEDRPGVTGVAPRKIAQPRQPPLEDVSWPRRRHRRTASVAGACCRGSTPSTGDGSSTPLGRAG